MEGDETVTQRPFVHRLVKDDVLRENDHGDVLEPTEPLQDLGHGLGFGFLHHAADPHHDLLLWGLDEKTNIEISWFPRDRCACQCSGPTVTLNYTHKSFANFGEAYRYGTLIFILADSVCDKSML